MTLQMSNNTLTASRIIAHKRSGEALVYLTQTGDTFLLSYGKLIENKFQLIAEKSLTAIEAHEVLISLFGIKEKSETILLEVKKVLNTAYAVVADVLPIESPYFPTKEIFLSHQMTGAPNF